MNEQVITVISGTNRSGNLSILVSRAVVELLTAQGIETKLLDLQTLPEDFAFKNEVYSNSSAKLKRIIPSYIGKADRFVFVIPEYNGSFPGVCKAFIDAVKPDRFRSKKACIVGISSGRAGNLRGADHLTGILNYLNVAVFPKHVNITHVDGQVDESGRINSASTQELLERSLKSFVDF
ncbi:MAG: NAD(P)H-dependent oxidoreductase [Flavobacteriales bacterium]|nr:NAD(P)H-dependent oxidoreductase [Flavobacteriales bacterium]NCG30765.1 hypothetical protein [Bacteroidota bacterium]MBT3964728.1 NAD(P)H-dependent oxidoreductase [Flavobacteriales bacterium]MBT4704727.1 NAD(P)H-dependent oxidoreductase [Flavobacteriales bacterium]MBT4931690.1 NAD(P)H-dependent oxidoreductase [Flavobacteriales bacterium]